jgi:hypothetical protein
MGISTEVIPHALEDLSSAPAATRRAAAAVVGGDVGTLWSTDCIMAITCAPYFHPKLKRIEVTGKENQPIEQMVTLTFD